MRRPRLGMWLLLVLGFAARPGAAHPVHIEFPAGGETLIAGQVVEVEWRGLPADVEEMELLLELDAGPVQRLRLTPQLVADAQSYLWQVPNLPSQRARLRLRWGRGGFEVEGDASPAFRILPDARLPAEELRLRGGEWWADDPFSLTGPCCDDNHPVMRARAETVLAAVISDVTEVSHDETGRCRELYEPHRRPPSPAQPLDPSVAAHGPSAIPLRP